MDAVLSAKAINVAAAALAAGALFLEFGASGAETGEHRAATFPAQVHLAQVTAESVAEISGDRVAR